MKRLLLIVLAVVCCVCVNAAPAYPGLITSTQKDGTQISYYLRGDEHFSFMMTEDGYLLTKNQDGILEYAKIKDGKQIVATGVKANNLLNRTVNEQNYVSSLTKVDGLKAELESMRNANINVEKSRMPAAGSRPSRFPLKGSPKGLIILVSYTDVAFNVPRADFDSMANQHNYSENYGTGSIRDYFTESSFGQFTPTYDVYGPYTLPHNRAYYGAQTGSQNDANAQQMIIDACNAASAAGVDFTQYDNDNDGTVDNIFVYFAGHNQAEGGPDESIWPHRSRVSTSNTYNGKHISDYSCTSEYRGSSGSTMCGIGTFCHEFSHVLGLPDFYDTQYSGGLSAMGPWDIMTSGNYNNGGHTPPTYTAYERFYIGWLTPIALANDTSVNCEGSYKLKSLISSNTAYLVSATQHNLSATGPNPSEFFMLEFRKVEGRDTYSGLCEGLLVTHINFKSSTWSNNQPNDDKTCLGYYPVLPGITDELHTASSSASSVFPYNSYDYCLFTLHGAEDPMERRVINIVNEDSCCTFDYASPNEKLFLSVHNVDAYQQPIETQFKVLGKQIHENLTVGVTNNREFLVRVHTDDNSGTYKQTVTLTTDSNGFVVDSIVDVKYTPLSVTYDTYSETKFNVRGQQSTTLTSSSKFSYRNRRPVYVVAPEAYDAKMNSGAVVLSWSFVADTAAGTPDIEKYGAKYYLDVYNISDQPQTETEGFESFPDTYSDDWTINFDTYTDQYRKSGQRAALFTSNADTIYTKEYFSDITNVSYWIKSVGAAGTFRAEVMDTVTGKWETLEKVVLDKSTEKTTNLDLPSGYNRLRLYADLTDGTLAIDDIAVTTSKAVNYAAKNLYLRDTTYTLTGLTQGATYNYVVRATDKDEAGKTPRYENVTENSNLVTFTVTNGGGGQKSDDGKLVTSFDAATGQYLVSIPEVKEGYAMFVYNASGNLVYKTAVTSTTVVIPSMSAGVYLVKYTTDDKKNHKSDAYGKLVYRGTK